MLNFSERVLGINMKDAKLIPFNCCPTKYYTISFEGWTKVELVVQDETFNQVLNIASQSLKSLIDMYKETHAFTEPQFIYDPKGVFKVRIATMELELYEKLMNKESKDVR